jgi:hypothetical protein
MMRTARQLNAIFQISVGVFLACVALNVFVLSHSSTLYYAVTIFGFIPLGVMIWAAINLTKLRAKK